MLDLSQAINTLANASVQKQVIEMSMATLTSTLGSKEFQATLDAILTALDKAISKYAGKDAGIAQLMGTSAGLNIIDKLLTVVMSSITPIK